MLHSNFVLQLNHLSELPNDYGTTPGGTLFSTTPGGSLCLKYFNNRQ